MASKILPYLRKSLYVLSIIILLVVLYFLYENQQSQICTFVKIKIEAPINGSPSDVIFPKTLDPPP